MGILMLARGTGEHGLLGVRATSEAFPTAASSACLRSRSTYVRHPIGTRLAPQLLRRVGPGAGLRHPRRSCLGGGAGTCVLGVSGPRALMPSALRCVLRGYLQLVAELVDHRVFSRTNRGQLLAASTCWSWDAGLGGVQFR